MTDPIDTDAVWTNATRYAVRHADLIEKGIDQARSVLAHGDAAIAAHLLGLYVDALHAARTERNALREERDAARAREARLLEIEGLAWRFVHHPSNNAHERLHAALDAYERPIRALDETP